MTKLGRLRAEIAVARQAALESRDDSALVQLARQVRNLERAIRLIDARATDLSPEVKDRIAKIKERKRKKRKLGNRGVSQPYGAGDQRSTILSGGLVRPR